MKKQFLSAVFLLSTFFLQAGDQNQSFFQNPQLQTRIDFAHPDMDLLNEAFFYETNLRRQEKGLPALQHLKALDKTAQMHCADMVKYNYFSHESPIKGQETLSKRLAAEGITLGYSGENIARGFGLEYESGKSVYPPEMTGAGFRYSLNGPDILPRTYLGLAQVLLDQLMNSPPHRYNILSPDYTYLGCSIITYKAVNFYNMDYFLAVQNFSSYSNEN